MRRTIVLFALVLSLTPLARAQQPASTIAQARPAQTPRPVPPERPPVPRVPVPDEPMAPRPPAPPEPAPTQNIRLDLKISDSAQTTSQKTVSMMIAERRNGRVRSQNGGFILNVDARPEVVKDGRIVLNLTLEYQPRASADDEPQRTSFSNVNESLGMLLVDGKPTIVSQSADPISDRKVTVEVTATLVK